jgi:tetratricopeptide (TPR) repeat protein
MAPESRRAQELYDRTEYANSLKILLPLPEKDASSWQLIGQNYFMLGEYKKATDAFEKSVGLDPRSSQAVHWLGRAYGRRAETGNPFTAPGYASRARQMFERAVTLDPNNKEAVNDLFDYYLQAPGFMGGGFGKAEALSKQIAALDEAEGHYAAAQLADKRKEFENAEQQLRRAMELAPRQVGRVLDLAKFLAKRGRHKESDAVFEQAMKLAPQDPKVYFERASTLINSKRNLEEARSLLKKYLESPLTPDDPPRQEAEKLLKQTGA